MIALTKTRAALAGVALAAMTPAAEAASITLERLTTPIESNVKVTAAPDEIASGLGSHIASGLVWSGGASLGAGIEDSFLAWCFDLVHSISLGATYTYEVVETPFANSYLLSGAETRASQLFNANYGTLDASDPVQAGAFQMALWEVSNDDGFDLSAGAFQARGKGGDKTALTTTAQGYLDAAADFDGTATWRLSFLETRAQPGSQNLVTATLAPVPLPAAGLLLLGALGGLARLRRLRGARD